MTCPGCGAPNADDAPACLECGLPVQPQPVMGKGFVLAARYEIVRLLGRGGMGMVYEAKDRLLEETVAIKVLRPEAAASPGIAQRFRAEIKLARAVSHKNVCRIHEYGEDRGIRYISMAYVDGVDLKQVLRQRGPLPPAEAFDAVIPVAHALQAIHDEGIVHRDLKTPNIMLDGRGVVRLMDFGIAKQDQGDGLSMTVTGQIIGTPEYMSPEQVQAHRLDGRSDVYSLGIVVFEVFTGVTPFRADTPLGTVLKHLNEPPPLDGAQAMLLPAAVVPVLRKALAKKREDRYASATEMAQALEAARAATPVSTERVARAATRATAGAGETLAATLDQRTTQPTLERPRASAATTTVAAAGPRARRSAAPIVAAVAALGVVAAVIVALALREPRPTSAVATPSAAQPSAPAQAPSPRTEPVITPTAPSPASALASPAMTPPPPAVAGLRAQPARPSTVPPTAPPPAEAAPPVVDTRVEKLLGEAEAALAAQNLDTAIERYEAALAVDPRNAIARMGRATALGAKAGRAPAPAPQAPTAGFVPGRTAADSAETRPDAAFASAFEDTPGVAVTRDTQPAQLSGRIEFRSQPASVGPGDAYKLEVRFANSGRAAIEIRDMLVTTTVNGRRASGPVASAASTVAPGQAATLLALSDTLRQDLVSWSLEVVVHTSRGERYRNRLDWSATGAARPAAP